MCDGILMRAFEARCVKHLLALDDLKVVVLIIDSRVRPTRLKRMRSHKLKSILFRCYMKFVCKPAAYRPVDMSALLANVPSIRCVVTNEGAYSQYFSDADIKAIRGYHLDFILRFGFGIIRGEILNSARYGIWSFHHGDPERYRGRPACFWEIYQGDDATGAVLQRLTERLDGGIVLKKGFVRTVKYSYARTIDAIYLESSRWPAQVCRELLRGDAYAREGPPSPMRAPIRRAPTNREMVLFLLKLLRNVVGHIAHALFRHDVWSIGVVDARLSDFLGAGPQPEIRYVFPSRRGTYLADPFGIQGLNTLTVLCERYDYRTRTGHIAAIELGESCSLVSARVLESASHMSYPYLLEHDGDIYCIPETRALREVALYVAEVFPHTWRRLFTLVKDVAASDPTVFWHEGLWWLTYVDQELGAPDCNLCVWYADELLGDWQPHRGNPVKTDIRSARPAGTPFVQDGRLYRPAQDCSRTYGGRIVLNHVERLTPWEFVEEPAAVIEPSGDTRFSQGVHTVSAIGDCTLIDGKRLTFVPREFGRTVGGWCRKISWRAGRGRAAARSLPPGSHRSSSAYCDDEGTGARGKRPC